MYSPAVYGERLEEVEEGNGAFSDSRVLRTSTQLQPADGNVRLNDASDILWRVNLLRPDLCEAIPQRRRELQNESRNERVKEN